MDRNPGTLRKAVATRKLSGTPATDTTASFTRTFRRGATVVVRLSLGAFAPEKASEVRAKLDESRASLEPALRQLRGLVHYYVAVDEQASTMVNVSVWTGLAEAKQMDSLAPMSAQRAVFEELGVRFDPIRNYPTLWTITP
jgi:hypothetical protein